jgi:hypothetical protein
MRLPDGSRTAAKVFASSIIDFEDRIKRNFRNNGRNWATDVGIEAQFPEAGIEDSYMVFTNEEILTSFKPMIDRVFALVDQEVKYVTNQRERVDVGSIIIK